MLAAICTSVQVGRGPQPSAHSGHANQCMRSGTSKGKAGDRRTLRLPSKPRSKSFRGTFSKDPDSSRFPNRRGRVTCTRRNIRQVGASLARSQRETTTFRRKGPPTPPAPDQLGQLHQRMKTRGGSLSLMVILPPLVGGVEPHSKTTCRCLNTYCVLSSQRGS